MLKKKSYINEEISNLPIKHSWNDWDPFEELNQPNELLKTQLRKISNNGITCFTLGCAEWVVHRLLEYIKDDNAFYYIEAFWLYVMGVDEALPPETNSELWEGKLLGPINLALMTVLNTIYLAEHGAPIQNGALAVEIVNHVITDNKAFKLWVDEVIKRLIELCPRTKEKPEGKPLPPEILDPAFDYNDEDRMRLLNKNVFSINFDKNPFLKKIDKQNLILKEDFD